MQVKINNLLFNTQCIISNAEARRYMLQGCVFLNGERVIVEEGQTTIEAKVGDVLKIGKRTVTLTENHLKG